MTLRQTCPRKTSGAICVQRFDDSRNSAIHTTYRISLRSSSLQEPRYPLLRVVLGLVVVPAQPLSRRAATVWLQRVWIGSVFFWGVARRGERARPPAEGRVSSSPPAAVEAGRLDAPRWRAGAGPALGLLGRVIGLGWLFCGRGPTRTRRPLPAPPRLGFERCVNDPSAGSPTEQ